MPYFRCFGFAAIAAACALPARAAIIMHKDLSLSVARAIAKGAVAACAEKGYAISAVVVDREGETIVEMRGDDAAPHTMENARRKAYTAMTFKQPTAEYAKKLQDPNAVAHQQVTFPMSLPFRAASGRDRRSSRGRPWRFRFAGRRRRLRERRSRQGEGPAQMTGR